MWLYSVWPNVGLKSRAEVKNRYLPSALNVGLAAAYHPSVTSCVAPFSSEYRYTFGSESVSGRANATQLLSGDHAASRISNAFARFTRVTAFVCTSTNWSRSFLSDHRIFFESGDQAISYL